MVNYAQGWVDSQDVVTQVPPLVLGYRHAGSLVRLHEGKAPGLFSPGSAPSRMLEMAPSHRKVATDTELEAPNARVEALTTPEEVQRFMTQLSLKNAAEAKAPSVASGIPGRAPNQEAVAMAAPRVSYHKTSAYLSRSGAAVVRRDVPANGA